MISVITPTWRRHDLLMNRCLPSVYSQTCLTVEHVVVSDGPDDVVENLIAGSPRPRTRPLVFHALGEHRDGTVDYGSRARNLGARHASGVLIAYLDDDNAYRPNHLTLLAAALRDNPDADFAYSRMVTHPQGTIVGSPEPAYGAIDTSLIMHRADTLDRFGHWPLPDELDGDKHAPDWGVVNRWLSNGARWVHVPEVTVDYYFAGS